MKYENNKIVYEVGDWAVITGSTVGCTEAELGVAYEVLGWENDNVRLLTHFDLKRAANHCRFNDVRPATQEEINKAPKEEKIMVGEYEVEFYKVEGSRPHTIKVGCVKVSEELFLKIGKKWGLL